MRMAISEGDRVKDGGSGDRQPSERESRAKTATDGSATKPRSSVARVIPILSTGQCVGQLSHRRESRLGAAWSPDLLDYFLAGRL